LRAGFCHIFAKIEGDIEHKWAKSIEFTKKSEIYLKFRILLIIRSK